jgi:hypothetical protein
MQHCPMQHVQEGYTGSHWTLPSGDCMFRIAPAAARATIIKTTMQNVPTLLAISMAITMRRYYTAHIKRWRRFMVFLKATKRRHWASNHSDSNSINQTCLPLILGVFHHQIVEKVLELP